MSRRYSESIKQDAATIVFEVIVSGKSEGWQGDLSALEERRSFLSQFNIVYTDDMRGTWEHRP